MGGDEKWGEGWLILLPCPPVALPSKHTLKQFERKETRVKNIERKMLLSQYLNHQPISYYKIGNL